ncbi:MAG: hypothetical protein Q8J64_04760 [Thermodesulfovibrionales bacterium]|nr:hypothetical protein [Thermodesulfovibrionales bacterium]
MVQRVHIQILDNPIQVMFPDGESNDSVNNRIIADELKRDLFFFYPSVVSVEYIDLFIDDEGHFPEIRELLRQGAIKAPVILINGIPKIHGGIPSAVIKNEVENMISSGPTH